MAAPGPSNFIQRRLRTIFFLFIIFVLILILIIFLIFLILFLLITPGLIVTIFLWTIELDLGIAVEEFLFFFFLFNAMVTGGDDLMRNRVGNEIKP